MRTRSMTARSAVPAARSRAGRTTAHDLRSGGIQKRKKAAMSKGKKPAAAASKAPERNLSEATHILKLKKEAFEAQYLWRERRVPGALDRWLKAKEEEAKAEAEAARPKKKKMVLKTTVPQSLIDLMKIRPFRCIRELTADDLANRSEAFRELYAMRTYIDSKMRAYEEALVRQHDSQGYALDETEVTDDDMED